MAKQRLPAEISGTTNSLSLLDTLLQVQHDVINGLHAFQPDQALLPQNPSVGSQTFAQAFARYLTGSGTLVAAQEAWEEYTADVATKPLGPLQYRRLASAPEVLTTYARALSGEVRSLDAFTCRVIDICLEITHQVGEFLRECEDQGPVGAVCDYLRRSGLEEDAILGLLLHDHSAYPLRPFRNPLSAGSGPEDPLEPNALGRYLLTLLPERLPEMVEHLSRLTVSDRFRNNLPALVTLLATSSEDRRFLPLAWQAARLAPPLLAGLCADVLCRYDASGFDTDVLAQTGLRWGSPDATRAACRVLLDVEHEIVNDELQMRQLLWQSRHWTGTNPIDLAIPAWLQQSAQMVWWAPLLSAVADERGAALLGKGTGLNFWRELQGQARRSGVLIDIDPGRLRAYLTRDTFLRAYGERTRRAFVRAGMCLDVSASTLREAFWPRLGLDMLARYTLDYGGVNHRQVYVHVESDGTCRLYDPHGKPVPTLPAPAAGDDPEQAASAKQTVKWLKEQLAQLMNAGTQHLEQALRQHQWWQVLQWWASYHDHPLLRLLGTRVIWQIGEVADVSTTFRLLTDGRLVTALGTSLDLPEEGQVTLVQADALDRSACRLWQCHVAEAEVALLLDQIPA